MKWPEAMKNISRLVAIIATLLGYGVIAEAQEPGKIPWIGYPYLFSPSTGETNFPSPAGRELG